MNSVKELITLMIRKMAFKKKKRVTCPRPRSFQNEMSLCLFSENYRLSLVFN